MKHMSSLIEDGGMWLLVALWQLHGCTFFLLNTSLAFKSVKKNGFASLTLFVLGTLHS